jgi:hypothetical protein
LIIPAHADDPLGEPGGTRAMLLRDAVNGLGTGELAYSMTPSVNLQRPHGSAQKAALVDSACWWCAKEDLGRGEAVGDVVRIETV